MILIQITTNKGKQQISMENSCFDPLSLHLHLMNGVIRSDIFKDLIGNIFSSILNIVFAFEGF